MTLIFDDQSCPLQIAPKNLFDTTDFISNGSGYLFDRWDFPAITGKYLIFGAFCRKNHVNRVKQYPQTKKLGIFEYEDMEARAGDCSASDTDLDSRIIIDLFFTVTDGWGAEIGDIYHS